MLREQHGLDAVVGPGGAGQPMVLRVTARSGAILAVEADFVEKAGGWRFTWAASRVAPVSDVWHAAQRISTDLRSL
ncbi:hypothetical protein LO762_18250 [Actinocorallia sp. API 0066]|uniref:hypothetical protein n=1 Tax=Actinocorallia sp. API 0066 TaxID=2896846 RepID=UPI001E44255D|nr:hypothetical protein [Actinocorallia sp. API 0066]MCD0451125.1 hypothetical protein [Actinocorallia sp. API 0066]